MSQLLVLGDAGRYLAETLSMAQSQYMGELCDALIRVLDRCAQLDRRRLAGYAANIDFWIDEIQHRMRLIEGHADRRRKMLSGTDQVYADDIHRAHVDSAKGTEVVHVVEQLINPNILDVSTNWDAIQTEGNELRTRIVASSSRFVMNCFDTELIDRDKLFEIEDRLGVNLRSRKS